MELETFLSLSVFLDRAGVGILPELHLFRCILAEFCLVRADIKVLTAGSYPEAHGAAKNCWMEALRDIVWQTGSMRGIILSKGDAWACDHSLATSHVQPEGRCGILRTGTAFVPLRGCLSISIILWERGSAGLFQSLLKSVIAHVGCDGQMPTHVSNLFLLCACFQQCS